MVGNDAAPVTLLCSVGSTSFPALPLALLAPRCLALLPPASRIVVQHGATPLRVLLEPFLDGAQPGPEVAWGLHRLPGRIGYDGATRARIDPGEQGSLRVAFDAPQPQGGDAARPSGRAVRQAVRRRRAARAVGIDENAVESTGKYDAPSADEPNRPAVDDESSSDSSSEESSSGLMDWQLDARPSGPSLSSAGASGSATESDHGHRLNLVTPEGIRITFVDFVADLSVEIAQADVVCCHAGAGTLLDALREQSARLQELAQRSRRPKLLVVPNSTLMDDHQAELAAAMAQHDYCCAGNVATLPDDLAKILARSAESFAPFPPFSPTRVRALVDDIAGFPAS